MKFRIGVGPAPVSLVSDELYPVVLTEMVAGSRQRLLCSLFIVDLAPKRDPGLRVDQVLHSLSEAAWRGVDVRLLIGGSRINTDLIELADAGRQRALSLGIPCRWLTATRRRGSHSKFVVADDLVLVGSHNWSMSAFGESTQDSVRIQSADLAAHVTALFEKHWKRAELAEDRRATI